MAATTELRDALFALMRNGVDTPLPDATFNHYALAAFAHQFKNNEPYRKYCERRRATPATIRSWTDVPAVPTAAFKELTLAAGDAAQASLVFRTSGTTRGAERRGTHYILDPAMYEASLLPTFRRFVLNEQPMRLLSLITPSSEAPDSSLSYMATVVMQELGTEGSGFLASAQGIDFEALDRTLSDINEPVCLLGTSLAFLHWLEGETDFKVVLPTGSRLMDTGGFKGDKRAIDGAALRALYAQRLGLSASDCINEYGMTELCSQYYDDTATGTKRGPPWIRARIVDPDTLAPMPKGEAGIVQHFDLANLNSVSSIQTDDLAIETDTGFKLLGRAPGATPRGCSIAMDLLLSTART